MCSKLKLNIFLHYMSYEHGALSKHCHNKTGKEQQYWSLAIKTIKTIYSLHQ